MVSNWEKLPIVSHAALPTLLYRFTTTVNSYELYITDLVHTWSEKLSRKEIISRATVEETSIDPGEDSDQFEVFLQKLRDALAGTEKSHVSLRTSVVTDSYYNNFRITATIQLPAPLDPLIWTFYATQESAKEFAARLIVPLLQAQIDRDELEKSILKSLKEKDWVLGKIFDKLESLGVDLSAVFPGTVGLHSAGGLSRTRAAKYIPALTPFNESTWRKENCTKSTILELSRSLTKGALNQQAKCIEQDKVLPRDERWWEKLKDHDLERPTGPSQREERPPTTASTHRTFVSNDEGSSDEDDFQRQKTPPRLKKMKSQHLTADIDSDTASESDEPVRQKIKSPQPSKYPNKARGIGKIGGTWRMSSPEPVPKAVSERKGLPPELKPTLADEETQSEEGEPNMKQISSLALLTSDIGNQEDEKATKPKFGMARDGKAKASAPQMASPSQSTDNERNPPSGSHLEQSRTPPKGGSRLGVIGFKKDQVLSPHPQPNENRADESTASEDDTGGLDRADRFNVGAKLRVKTSSPEKPKPAAPSSPSPPPKPTVPEEPRRELTAQEKANKRREELKRDLEAKSKGPSKKKRKF